MKILFVQDTDWIRKNPIQHNHLLERMVKRGHEVRVIDFELLWKEGKKELFSQRKEFNVSRMLKDAYHQVIRPGILKIPLLDYLSIFLTYPTEIRRQLREFQPDVVIGDGLLTPFFAFRLAKKYHIKTIYYCIDLDYRLMPYRFLQGVGKSFESYNMRQADLVLSINEGLRDYTIRMGTKPSKTQVIRAGFDPNRFNPKINGDHLRKRYGIKQTDFILFFIGWLYHFSGLKEVTKELKNSSYQDIKLFIVGDGDAYEELQKLIKENNLDNKVILAGKQDYKVVPEYMSLADIFLLPAYPDEPIMQDIVPIKMYEYMAMEKPVIATRFSGIEKEFGEDNGVIYIDNPQNVLKTVSYLRENNCVHSEGKKAGTYVKKNNWERLTDHFEKTLQRICSNV